MVLKTTKLTIIEALGLREAILLLKTYIFKNKLHLNIPQPFYDFRTFAY